MLTHCPGHVVTDLITQVLPGCFVVRPPEVSFTVALSLVVQADICLEAYACRNHSFSGVRRALITRVFLRCWLEWNLYCGEIVIGVDRVACAGRGEVGRQFGHSVGGEVFEQGLRVFVFAGVYRVHYIQLSVSSALEHPGGSVHYRSFLVQAANFIEIT